MAENQRRFERYTVEWRLDYLLLRPNEMLNPQGQKAVILDISAGGFGFFSSAKVSVGDICAFGIYPAEQNRPFLAIGQIFWATPVGEGQSAGARWLFWASGAEKESVLEAARSTGELSEEIVLI